MNQLPFRRTLTILLFLLLASCLPAKAGHYLGGDITYRNTGKDTYLVTVTVYRDCNASSLAAADISYWYCSTSNLKKVTPGMGTGRDITPVCAKQCTRCNPNNPNQGYGTSCSLAYGIESFQLTAQVVIPSTTTCCTVYFGFGDGGSRTSSINTGAASDLFYIEASANRCLGTLDNSATFTNEPMIFAAEDRCNYFSDGPVDKDLDARGLRDSIRAFFTQPLGGSGGPSFTSPYAWQRPLRYHGFPKSYSYSRSDCYGWAMDSLTGDFRFRPSRKDYTIYAVRVESYGFDASGRKVRKGYVTRDVPIIVYNYKSVTQYPPVLSGLDSTSAFSANLCPGVQRCFTIHVLDSNATDPIRLNWNPLPPGVKVTVSPGSRKLQFCWKPDTAQIGTRPYLLRFYARDSACPFMGQGASTYALYVRPLLTHKATVSESCGQATFRLKVPNSSLTWNGEGGLWGTGDTLQHTYAKPGAYKWKVTAANSGSCSSIADSGVLTVKSKLKVKFPISTELICTPDSILLQPTITDAGGTLKYRWSTGDSTGSLLYRYKKDSIFFVTVTDGYCADTDRVHVQLTRGYGITAGKDTTLCGDGTLLDLSDLGPSPTLGTWSGSNISNGGMPCFDPSLVWTAWTGKHKIAYTIFEYYGYKSCTHSDTVIIEVKGKLSPKADKYGPFCSGADSVLLKGTPVQSPKWSIGSTSIKAVKQLGSDYYLHPRMLHPGRYRLLYSVSHSGRCPESDTASYITVLEESPAPTISLLGKDSLQTVSGKAGYRWYRNGKELSFTTHKIPLLNTGGYKVQYLDGNGCYSDLSSGFFMTGQSDIPEATPSLHLYPNPAGDVLYIEREENSHALRLTFRDMLGRTLHATTLPAGISLHELSLQGLPQGVLFLHAEGPDGEKVYRVVKK